MTTSGIDIGRPFIDGACSLRIQTVLFGNTLFDIERSLSSIDRAAKIGLAQGCLSMVEVAYGDSSPDAVMGPDDIENYRSAFPNLSKISYVHFGANLGSAGRGGRVCLDRFHPWISGCSAGLLLSGWRAGRA
jgi:hypothetical protein